MAARRRSGRAAGASSPSSCPHSMPNMTRLALLMRSRLDQNTLSALGGRQKFESHQSRNCMVEGQGQGANLQDG